MDDIDNTQEKACPYMFGNTGYPYKFCGALEHSMTEHFVLIKKQMEM